MLYFFQIVNSKLQILNMNARYPGARNDSYIWSMSPVRRAMEYHFSNGERQTWLIGMCLKLFFSKTNTMHILCIIWLIALFILS